MRNRSSMRGNSQGTPKRTSVERRTSTKLTPVRNRSLTRINHLVWLRLWVNAPPDIVDSDITRIRIRAMTAGFSSEISMNPIRVVRSTHVRTKTRYEKRRKCRNICEWAQHALYGKNRPGSKTFCHSPRTSHRCVWPYNFCTETTAPLLTCRGALCRTTLGIFHRNTWQKVSRWNVASDNSGQKIKWNREYSPLMVPRFLHVLCINEKRHSQENNVVFCLPEV